MQRILLVEDEPALLDALTLNLELEGFEVTQAKKGNDALELSEKQRFNLVILDVMLPEVDGFSVCERIRLNDHETPILFLTAKNDTADKIKGLKIGADDYLTKPFDLEELLLRVKILVKHSVKGTSESKNFHTYAFGGNEVNFINFEATLHTGERIRLTNKEAKLLKLLIDKTGEVVSRQHILNYVWGYDIYPPSTRTIDNFMLSFRKYFEKDPKIPVYFHSVRGVGYKFEEGQGE